MRIALIMLVVLASCSSNRTICKTPTRREINKAMSYSSWQYAQPSIKTYRK